MKQSFWTTVEKVILDSDIVLYILDARFPQESRNADVEKLIQKKKKKCVYVVTKYDLAQNKRNAEYDALPKPFVRVSAKDFFGILRLKEIIIITGKRLKLQKPRVGVVGYPNIGKSSLINALVGKNRVKISSMPGCTLGQQYVNAGNFLLIDTPGVIPRAEHDEIRQIKIMSSTEMYKDPEYGSLKLMEAFPGIIEQYFGVDKNDDYQETLAEIARKKCFLLKGGLPDIQRAGRHILQVYQKDGFSKKKIKP